MSGEIALLGGCVQRTLPRADIQCTPASGTRKRESPLCQLHVVLGRSEHFRDDVNSHSETCRVMHVCMLGQVGVQAHVILTLQR